MKAWTVQSLWEGVTHYAFVHVYPKEDVVIIGPHLAFSDMKEFALRLARKEDAEMLLKLLDVQDAFCKEEEFNDP